MSDENDFKLRDQFAISIMTSLLSTAKVDANWFVTNREEGERFDKEIEKFAITAYKIADAMRKARIIAFK